MEDMYFAAKLAWQKLFKFQPKVNSMTGMHLTSAHILDAFRKLRSLRMWHNAMNSNPEDETSYIT